MTTLDFAHCLPFSNVNNFKSFVDRLLMFLPNQVSLECFRMCDFSCNGQYDDGDDLRLYGWICAVLRRRVKEIDIYFECSTVLPTLLFTSESLRILALNIHGEMKVPSKVCLPNLKILELRNMEFSDAGSICRLISGCLLLEELYMQLGLFPKNIANVFIDNPSLKVLSLDLGEGMLNLDNHLIVINAPNLLYFKYVDTIAESYCFRSMNSLRRADIRVYQFADEGTYDVNSERSAAYLLQTICNVKSLRLTIDQAETLIPMRPAPVVTFHKVVKLEFVTEYDDWQGTWLIDFLHCVPNLNTLVLTLEPAKKGIKPLPEKVPPCLLLHLKEIKLSEFDGDEHVFEMIRYFLQHAIVLEKLEISMKSLMTAGEQLGITKKLLMIPRNSEKCQVAAL